MGEFPSVKDQFKSGEENPNFKHSQEIVLEKVKAYILECTEQKKRPNIAGFCLFADMNKSHFYWWEHNNPGNQASSLLSNFIEDYAVQGLNRYPAGNIFQLKQPRYGWIDQSLPQLPPAQNIQINFIGEGDQKEKVKTLLTKGIPD